jgi:virginiamycin B lyase
LLQNNARRPQSESLVTEKFRSWAIPGGGDTVRNMDVARNGNPILANQVGIVEVK